MKTPRKSKAIRDSARGEACTMCSPGCNGDPAKTVLCHSNELIHGKGRGIKSYDCFSFYGCSGCNFWYDEGSASKEEKRRYLMPAMARTAIILLEKGLLTMKGAK